MQSFFAIDLMITGAITLLFGLLVISKNWKNIINRSFFLLTIATALWSFAYWRWLSIYDSAETALFWVRILSIGSLFIPLFTLHWIISLLDLNKKFRRMILLSYFLVFIFLLFSFSPLFINRVEANPFFPFWPKPGPIYSLYLFTVYFGLVVYSVILLFRGYKNAVGSKREQLKYVIIGSILGFGGGATNFFLWYDINIPPYGTVFVVLYPILFAYAIIKHRFMDIKLVLRKYSVNIATILSVIIPTFLIKYSLNYFFHFSFIYLDALLLVVSLSVFVPLKDYYFQLANKYFFSSLYDTREVIGRISDRLSTTLDARRVYTHISDILLDVFHSKSLGILTYDQNKKEYTLAYNVGIRARTNKVFKDGAQLQKDYMGHKRPIILEELKHSSHGKYKDTISILESLDTEILVSLEVKNKPIGLLILGPKESGDAYNEEDLSVLKVVDAQMAITIENSLLYEESRRFNKKLREEIEIATVDLKGANEKLKKLDAAKSEFISIASHQLRTPLTAIKGYISMILEGDFGVLTDPEKESLEKVFESNERLIKLVENLLNISRIESGRLQFNFENIHLENMVSSVMDELHMAAKRKNLNVEYHKPENPLPLVNVDEQKIRQVVLNLIDNAFKYTKEGTVTVTLEQEEDKLKFCVSDSGMGISADDLPHLFNKFTRGTGTSLVHTEGTGLGLYVARQMIEAHHGEIWAESRGEGLGSKFCFKLPISLNTIEAIPVSAPAPEPANANQAAS